MSDGDAKPVLEAINLTKRFPGVVALDQVNFDLRPGEIHALCGENGAGKSTLIKLLSGIHPHGSYEGTIRINQHEARFASIRDAQGAGLAVIYQELALVGEMTAGENIFLGQEPRHRGLIDWDTVFHQSQTLLDRFGIAIDPAAPVASLGVGQQQLVEIAKALGKQSRILVLDEPTAALTEQEVEILLNILRDLRKQGMACVYISHKLDEVFAIADRITVLRDGQSVATFETAQTNAHDVIHHMVGRQIKDMFPRRPAPVGEVLLAVRDLTVAPRKNVPARIKNVSFDVRAGEVLGIGGLMGAGRSEMLMHLFGVWGHRLTGTVELDGEPMAKTTASKALKRGLVLVSEDRKRLGLVLEQSVGFNLSLSSLDQLSHYGLVDADAETTINRHYFQTLGVRSAGLQMIVNNLSGGNQQKVVLGKALMTQPKVVFLDEATRGIDIGAKVEIYELINDLTARGLAVVLVSSELPELMGMSDRIVMLADGAMGGTFTREQATQERLLAAAMGPSVNARNDPQPDGVSASAAKSPLQP